MSKSDFKKLVGGKEHYIAWTLRDRHIICLSNAWKKWAKQYINRKYRRKKILFPDE